MENVAEWEIQKQTMGIDKDLRVHSTCREQSSNGAFSMVKSDFEFTKNPAVNFAVTSSCANSDLDVEIPGTDEHQNENPHAKSMVRKPIGKNL